MAELIVVHTATVEFQKRGLPNGHILLIMEENSKPRTPAAIDSIVCAELPDKAVNPELHKVITSNNVHGQCGAINPNSPCMHGLSRERWCTKDFPKAFRNNTTVSQDSYPEYRRRTPNNGGFTHSMRVKGADFVVDNSFVVPYNPLLSLRYQAHISVEIVHSVQAVKYIYKYITKGQDWIIMRLDG